MSNKNESKSKKTVLYISVFILLFGLSFGLGVLNSKRRSNKSIEIPSEYQNLKSYSSEDLKEFDGSDLTKPIYIGMNGLVYDVSAGVDFYKVDGPYHYLAGKDSSTELNMVGGSIIKKKYPVIGKLK